MPRYIGKSIPRLEDERLVTGRGRYTNDTPPPGAAWAYVLRSPHAHAAIKSIDARAALAMPGAKQAAASAPAEVASLKVAGLNCFISVLNAASPGY